MSPLLFALGLLASPPAAPPSAPLERLHPDLRERLTGLFADAQAAGVPLKLLSGYRKLDVARARAGRASWHAFGLAVDVNLHNHSSMRTALAHIRQDREKWETIGRLAEARGLVWGGRWRDEEVFHVEWHPGMPSALQGDTLKSLLAVAGPDGRAYQQTWSRFSASPEVVDPTCPSDDLISAKIAEAKKKPRKVSRRRGRGASLDEAARRAGSGGRKPAKRARRPRAHRH
ncbi:MAG: M15 family metallopeptidase [Myxococcales bacterium]|nr:M15 family metallopeptidase [Myxococcales bacterium]